MLSNLLYTNFMIKKVKNDIKKCWYCECKCNSFVSICDDCKNKRRVKRS